MTDQPAEDLKPIVPDTHVCPKCGRSCMYVATDTPRNQKRFLVDLHTPLFELRQMNPMSGEYLVARVKSGVVVPHVYTCPESSKQAGDAAEKRATE